MSAHPFNQMSERIQCQQQLRKKKSISALPQAHSLEMAPASCQKRCQTRLLQNQVTFSRSAKLNSKHLNTLQDAMPAVDLRQRLDKMDQSLGKNI